MDSNQVQVPQPHLHTHTLNPHNQHYWSSYLILYTALLTIFQTQSGKRKQGPEVTSAQTNKQETFYLLTLDKTAANIDVMRK